MLTAITFTAGDRAAWLRACCKSVDQQKFTGLQHVIIECELKRDWTRLRLEALQFDEYIAFVDDDDIVLDNSLQLCLRAIKETGCGVAFTRQRLINGEEGTLGQVYGAPPATYGDIARLPQSIHHLAVMRRSSLDMGALASLADLLPHGAGLDWAMRANAAANGGAVHVPIVGYGWRAHRAQRHHAHEWAQGLRDGLPHLRAAMRAWFKNPADAVTVWAPATITGDVQCV